MRLRRRPRRPAEPWGRTRGDFEEDNESFEGGEREGCEDFVLHLQVLGDPECFAGDDATGCCGKAVLGASSGQWEQDQGEDQRDLEIACKDMEELYLYTKQFVFFLSFIEIEK